MKSICLISISVMALCLLPGRVMGQSSMDSLFGFNQQKYENVKVEKVLQSDLLQIEGGEIIKLIGVNRIAEVSHKKKVERDDDGFAVEEKQSPFTPMEEQAYEFVTELLEGQSVRLEFDEQKKDDAYHTLAYVFLLKDGLFVNAEILRTGMANLQIRPPNKKYQQELRSAYQEARREFIGIHNQ